MTHSVAQGGGSTINGVVYQLLWSLLHVAKIKIVSTRPDDLDHQLPGEVVLLLEPRGGGGDVQLVSADSRAIEQIKARSDGSSWSLREVIEGVLPDLFLAAADNNDATVFRFVTEGRMGAWKSVYESFFRSLSNREATGAVIDRLDNNTPLKFAHQRPAKGFPFFPDACTELDLFLKIVEVISERPTVKAMTLSEAELHEKVWQLLAGFDFDGSHPIAEVQENIDSLLLAIVDRQEEIPAVRDHLAMELAKAATKGNAEISADAFLSQHGLTATPLADWAAHRMRAAQVLQRTFVRRSYQPAYDVRRDNVAHVSSRRVLVVTGESGTGKSWMVNAIADSSANSAQLPILVESLGSAELDLQKASELFWHDVHDGDQALHLSRIARRLRKVAGDKADVGIVIFVDGVSSYAEASQLVQNDWHGWHSSLVISCNLEIATSLRNAFPNQVDIIDCHTFSWEQLHEVLDRRLGVGWPAIPEDVRDVLKLPLLAGIYCEEFGESGWLPASENELYEKVWNRLSSGSGSLLDTARVESLAHDVREGGPYPWTAHQLLQHGVDDTCLTRLMSVGWLVRTGDDRYRIFHDRLMQWTVAKSLCTELLDGRIALADVAIFISDIVTSQSQHKELLLGFVPMDVLWILSQTKPASPDLPKLLEALEGTDHRYLDSLYDDLVPTLGPKVADALFTRYRNFKGSPWVKRKIGRALQKVAGPRLEQFARPLVSSSDERQQRLGIALIKDTPCPGLLDKLWRVHISGQKDPSKFDVEKIEKWQLYRETFDALQTSARSSPDWLIGAVDSADSATEPVDDLAWLVANLDGDDSVWQRVKKQLFIKVHAEKVRCLLACIGRYRDKSELEWAKKWVKGTSKVTEGPLAIQTISRIDPDAAVALLKDTDPDDMAMSRRWSFSEVLARRPAETHTAMLQWMKSHRDPWKVGLLFEDNENDLTAEELTVLLDALEKKLTERLNSENGEKASFHREFGLLSKLAASHLLALLNERAGTALESALKNYLLRIGPRNGIFRDNSVREPAIAVLNLIGGSGFTDVINVYLQHEDQFGREDAIQWSGKRPNQTTIDLLSRIVVSDDQWKSNGANVHPINQNSAMKVLAWHGQWKSVASGLKKWGMHTSPDIAPPETPVTEKWVSQLRAEVEKTPTAGNVLALGTVGEHTDTTLIHKVIDSCTAESELAHACIIALENLGDRSNDGIRRIAPHLLIKKHHYSATRALTSAGGALAWQALFEDIKREFDFVTALNLINLSEHADAVKTLVLEKWSDHHGSDQTGMLRLLVTRIRDPTYRDAILQDPEVREFVHQLSTAAEGNFWFTGSKAAMIECLALFNSKAAVAAAHRCLENPQSHDRELYPGLLMRIDSAAGAELLIDVCTKEQQTGVRYAIGRALEDVEMTDRLLTAIASPDPAIREAACFLARWSKHDARLDEAIQARLDDSSHDVRTTALASRRFRADKVFAQELVVQLESESDPRRKTIFLDAFITLTDPGGENQELSPHLQRALDTVSSYEAHAAFERLKKRRKKLSENLKRMSRSS